MRFLIKVVAAAAVLTPSAVAGGPLGAGPAPRVTAGAAGARFLRDLVAAIENIDVTVLA